MRCLNNNFILKFSGLHQTFDEDTTRLLNSGNYKTRLKPVAAKYSLIRGRSNTGISKENLGTPLFFI
jgi:hypothetical protein